MQHVFNVVKNAFHTLGDVMVKLIVTEQKMKQNANIFVHTILTIDAVTLVYALTIIIYVIKFMIVKMVKMKQVVVVLGLENELSSETKQQTKVY